MVKRTNSSIQNKEAVSRRDFFCVASTYGLNSTMLAATALGSFSLTQLAQAAEENSKRRYKKVARHTLTFGASGLNEKSLLIERAGCIDFLTDVEDRTDGEIRIEFVGDNQNCGQLNCV